MKRLRAWRCPHGCMFLAATQRCPRCGEPCRETRVGSYARLRAVTTIRISDAGAPYRIGLATVKGGGTTLCRVEGNVRGHGNDRVRLVLVDGCYIALGAGARLLSDNPARRATTPGSQKD